MNVLFVAPSDEPFGGVISVVGHLARHFRQCGHNVIFVHPEETDRPRRVTTSWGFQGYRLNLRPPTWAARPIRSRVAFGVYFPLIMYHLVRLLRRHRIQIVNVHFPYDAFVYFALCTRLLRIPLVVSVHGADLFPGGQSIRRYPYSLRLLLRWASRVVAPSRAFLEDCLRVFPQLQPKATFIHNGVDLDELTPAPLPDPPAGATPYLLCIATHNEKKAIDTLLKAFAIIADTEPRLSLFLAGDGPLRGALENLSHALGLDGRVRFLGWQPRPDVLRLLHGCEALVLPSRSEPFGIAVLEAMACQKPVVATAVGGIPEIIENDHSGILVEPDNPAALADALLALFRDGPRRARLATNGYSTVIDRFRWQHTGSAYESLFSNVSADSWEAVPA